MIVDIKIKIGIPWNFTLLKIVDTQRESSNQALFSLENNIAKFFFYLDLFIETISTYWCQIFLQDFTNLNFCHLKNHQKLYVYIFGISLILQPIWQHPHS